MRCVAGTVARAGHLIDHQVSLLNMRTRLVTILALAVLLTASGCSVLQSLSGPPVVWTTFAPEQSRKLLSLTIDNRGVKWVGTDGDGAMALLSDNQRWMPMGSAEGRVEARTITDIEIDRSNNIWVVTLVGAAVVSAEGEMVETFTTGNELPASPLQDIAIDSDGNPWFANWGGGVTTLDRETDTWTSYTQAEGLLDDRVAFIRIDAEGNKWFGTELGVSFLTSAGEWRGYGPAAGFGQGAVWAIVGDIDGNLWCATQGGGVVVLTPDGQQLATYTTEDGLPHNTVNDVMIDTNANKWFATNDGLTRLSTDGTMTTFTTENGLGSNVITELSLDPFGNIWAATYGGGLSLYQPGTS